MNSSTTARLGPAVSIGIAVGIGRREVFLWVAAFLFANQALQVVDTRSFEAFGASLAEQNYIYWLACYAVIYRLHASDGGRRANRLDCVFALVTCFAVLLSSFVAYRFGVGLLATTTATYLLVSHGGDGHLKAAGSVLLALAAHLVWGPILFQFFTPELLRADAALVAGMLKPLRPDIIWSDTSFFAPGGHTISLVGMCSSFHNISAALLACATIAMLTRTEWVRRDIATATIACVAMILTNVARLCIVGWSYESYLFWHDGVGFSILAIAQTLVILLIAWWGVAPRGRQA